MLSASLRPKKLGLISLYSTTPQRCYSQAPKRDWRVLFFGTGEVALSSAKLLYSRTDLISRFELVCPPQKELKKLLPTPFWAEKCNVRTHEYHPPKVSKDVSSPPSGENKTSDSWDHLIELARKDFDIGIVVDFGYMLPSGLISAFPYQPLLMHPSLLPAYRGASPMEYAIMSGDAETGVTVLDVAPSKFDAGATLLSKTYAVDPRASGQSIRRDLAELGARALVESLENYETLQKTKTPQPVECTKAPKIKPNDYFVQWGSNNSMQVYNRWRALGPLTTTLYGCKHMKTAEDGTVRILLQELAYPGDLTPQHPLDPHATPGSLHLDKHSNVLWIKTEHDWLAATKLQIESGRRVIDPISFGNGIQITKNKSQTFGPTSNPL